MNDPRKPAERFELALGHYLVSSAGTGQSEPGAMSALAERFVREAEGYDHRVFRNYVLTVISTAQAVASAGGRRAETVAHERSLASMREYARRSQ